MRRAARSVHTIAHVLPFPAVGGTEHATLRIAQTVDTSRFRSVAYHLHDAQPVRAFFTAAGVPCRSYRAPVASYRHWPAYLRSSLTLARDLRSQRVDLVHCSDLLAASHAALAGWLARVPVLCHIRNRFDAISRRDCSFLWPVYRFVFVSHHTRQHFGCRVQARGVVVYDGIDIAPTAGAMEDRQSVRQEFNIRQEAPLVGMMARVAPQKDYTTLGRAAARVLHAVPATRFLIAGDYATGTNHEHYLRVRQVLDGCGVLGSFVFTGQRQDVARLLRALDVFVLSTHWEGLPLVILEAMAHRLPVVATAVDGIPEVVEDATTGLLFQHEDDRQLAAHLVALLSDPTLAARLGEAGQRRVQSRFSKEQFAASMNAVYTDILLA